MSKIEEKLSSVMPAVVADEANYKGVLVSPPEYKIRQLIPREGTGSQAASVTGTVEVNFELPSWQVMNLAKSSLTYTITPAASGSTTAFFNWIYTAGAPEISQITVTSRSGAEIMNLPFASQYSMIVTPAVREASDWDQTTSLDGLYKSNLLTTANYRSEEDSKGVTAVATVPYSEPRWLTAGTSAAATPVITKQYLCGDMFPQSFLAYPHDVPFPEIVNVRLLFTGNCGFCSASATNANAGQAALTGNVTFSNIRLYLATQVNKNISEPIIKQVQEKGLQLNTDFPMVFKQNFASSTSHSVSQRFNSSNGRYLKKIFYSVTGGTETNGYTYDHNNYNGQKLTSFQQSLNNVRMEDLDVVSTITNPTDWLFNRAFLKKKILGVDYKTYQQSWFHLQDFTADKSTVQGVCKDNLISGLSLKEEQKFDILATVPTVALNHYLFCIFAKVVSITSSGVTVN